METKSRVAVFSTDFFLFVFPREGAFKRVSKLFEKLGKIYLIILLIILKRSIVQRNLIQ